MQHRSFLRLIFSSTSGPRGLEFAKALLGSHLRDKNQDPTHAECRLYKFLQYKEQELQEAGLLDIPDTGSAPPAFLTLAQGLCPGPQNIGRAEICAILQVCHIATKYPDVTCEVWSDSSYAIDFVGRLLGEQALGQHGTDTDLCLWSGIWTKPCNLVLRKVSPSSAMRWLTWLPRRPEGAT